MLPADNWQIKGSSLAIGIGLLAIGYWLLAIGIWLLAVGSWQLAVSGKYSTIQIQFKANG